MPAGRTSATGLRVPLLTGVQTRATLGDAHSFRMQLARAMIDAGVAIDGRLEREEDVGLFLEESLATWVRDHGSDNVDRRFDLSAFVTPSLDPYYEARVVSDGDAEKSDHCFLCLDSSSAGAICVGSLSDWLAPYHARLAATVYEALLSGLNMLRYYGTWDAEEYFAMRVDGMDEEDLADVELPARVVPKPLTRKPLSARTIDQLLRAKRWPDDVRAVVERSRELARLGAAAKRDLTRQDSARRDTGSETYDLGIPVPAMIVAIEPHDFVFAAFDDESQWMLDSTPEPGAWWKIETTSARDVRAAFDGLAQRLEVLAAAVDLMDLFPKARTGVIPKKRRSGARVRVGVNAAPEGRPLADVLVDAFGDDDFDDVEIAAA